MKVRLEALFGAAERARIEAAVRAVEASTGGEIVPYVVARCGGDEEAVWKGAAVGSLLVAALAAAVRWRIELWAGPAWLWIVAPAALGGALGVLAAGVPWVARRLVGREALARRAERRAAEAFVAEEVFATSERTGILLFVAVFERRAVVLADRGIHARVPAGAWDGLIARLTAGLRAGRPAAALVAAIGECGDLLAEWGVAATVADRDELPDALRSEEI